MPTENLAEFLLYIAPGFLAVEIYRYYFPARERNNFTQIAQSVIWALVILTLIRYLDARYLGNWLGSADEGMPNTKFVFTLLIGGLLTGFLGVIQLKLRSALAIKYSKLSWLASEPDSIWHKINSPKNKDWSVIYLKDGSIYLGWISEFQADPNLVDQEFLLTKAKRIDADLKEKYLIDGLGVYLNTKDVIRIEFVRGNLIK
jgi:hypothetical protein